jgi:hypothetical protein
MVATIIYDLDEIVLSIMDSNDLSREVRNLIFVACLDDSLNVMLGLDSRCEVVAGM